LSTRSQNTSRLPLPAIPFALQIIFQFYLSSPAPPCCSSSLPCRYTYVLSSRIIGIISEDWLYAVASSPSLSSVRHTQLCLIIDEFPILGTNFLSEPGGSSVKIPLIYWARALLLLSFWEVKLWGGSRNSKDAISANMCLYICSLRLCYFKPETLLSSQ
jgi:hypothetical protein